MLTLTFMIAVSLPILDSSDVTPLLLSFGASSGDGGRCGGCVIAVGPAPVIVPNVDDTEGNNECSDNS